MTVLLILLIIGAAAGGILGQLLEVAATMILVLVLVGAVVGFLAYRAAVRFWHRVFW